jgi:hypothetical protein
MVAQHTGNGGGAEGGRGLLGKEACERHAYNKETREGVRYGNEGKSREPTSVPGKEGRTVQGRGECSTMLRPCEYDSRGPHHRRLPQDTQWQRLGKCSTVSGTGATSSPVFQILQITDGCSFFAALLPLLFPSESGLH